MASVGQEGRVEWTVEPKMTAAAMGSGMVEVFSTPYLCALAEAASVAALEGHLEDGNTSVGTEININHTAATAVGEKVHAVAKVVAVEKRKVLFEWEAFDGKKKIGHGTHSRFVLNQERFMAKLKE